LQPPHVVDHDGAELDRVRRDRRLVGIDRQRHRKLVRQLRDDGADPRQLLGLCDRGCAGSRRFAADIDDRAALRRHVPRMRDRRVGSEEAAAVGERIRSHVENSHHDRMGADQFQETVTPGALVGAHRPSPDCAERRNAIARCSISDAR
jgi:hypothetical protein